MEANAFSSYSDQDPAISGQPSAYPSHSMSMGTTNTNTTVVIQQPQGQGMVKPPRLWATGLMDCCDDMGICLCGLCCPHCHLSQISSDMGESACVPCCVPGGAIVLRTKWRLLENIQGSIMDDCCTLAFCGPCAMCQLAREMKYKKNGIMAFPS